MSHSLCEYHMEIAVNPTTAFRTDVTMDLSHKCFSQNGLNENGKQKKKKENPTSAYENHPRNSQKWVLAALMITSMRISTAVSDVTQFLLRAQIICYTRDSALPHVKHLILLLLISVCGSAQFSIFCGKFHTFPPFRQWRKEHVHQFAGDMRKGSNQCHDTLLIGLQVTWPQCRPAVWLAAAPQLWRHIFSQKLQLIDVKWSVRAQIESTVGETELGL